MMTHPLLTRLLDQGIPLLDELTAAAWIDAAEYSVLFFCGDPQRAPESLDVAVVLPELLSTFPQLQAALMSTALEHRLQSDCGVTLWPSLVFLRRGQYLGCLSRILSWAESQARVAEILTRAPQIPVHKLDADRPQTACTQSIEASV